MRNFKRPLREWQDDSGIQTYSNASDAVKANGVATEVKVPGFVVTGQWKDVNEFMTDLEHYLKILGQKHGVVVLR